MLFYLTVFDKNQRRQCISSGLLSSWDKENRKKWYVYFDKLSFIKNLQIFFLRNQFLYSFEETLLSRFLYDDILFFFFVPPNGYCTRHVLFTKEMICSPHIQLSLPFFSVFIVDVCTSCMPPPIKFFTTVQPMTNCLNILSTFIAKLQIAQYSDLPQEWKLPELFCRFFGVATTVVLRDAF